jgi:hypothetical protein
MIEPPLLGMVISNLLYQTLGFGPSKSICEPFATQVIAEAAALGVEIPGAPPQPGAPPPGGASMINSAEVLDHDPDRAAG